MGNHDLLEAAFGFAGSGMAKTVQDVRRHLLALGYSQRELQQLVGPSLARQLSRLIRNAPERGQAGCETAPLSSSLG
jgi:hypothetical protein